jgi:hypothetical protein
MMDSYLARGKSYLAASVSYKQLGFASFNPSFQPSTTKALA